jgi:hypothetical protein
VPTLSHEVLVQLVRAAPEALAELVRHLLGVTGPAVVTAHVTAAELLNMVHPEYHADAVITIGDPKDPDEAMIFESQGKIDPRKRESWPFYITGFRLRLRCPVTLVVLAIDPEVAAWAAEPIDLGRGRSIVRPLVIGPDQIPRISDPDAALRCPELAMLSAAAHHASDEGKAIVGAAIAAITGLAGERHMIYHAVLNGLLARVDIHLPTSIPDPTMALPAYEDWQPPLEELRQLKARFSDYESLEAYMREKDRRTVAMLAPIIAAEKAQRELIARGQAHALLQVLELRGFSIPTERRAQVEACRDAQQLDTWLRRALQTDDIAVVFASP